MEDLINIRKYFHQHPELSGKEYNTINKIESLVKNYKPTSILNLANTGKAFVFDSKILGKTTIIRADIDALPIQENNALPHKSKNKGVSHLCGHDGHTTIVIGLAQYLKKFPPAKGKVVLLFQPAEETGNGAHQVIQDKNFKKIEPDYVFGLHNIPSEKLHTIICKENTFASASKGMTIKLIGKTSHAAEPEKGISPTLAVSELIKELELIKLNQSFKQKILLTIVHIQLGEIAFGTSPGYAEIRVTLRAYLNEDLDQLTFTCQNCIKQIASTYNLKHNIEYSEIFPATTNHKDCTTYIKNATKNNNLIYKPIDQPYKWSEDFGYYTNLYKGGFFGLGAGINQPALHNAHYDFPDSLLESGINMFKEIIKQIHY